MKKKEKEIYLLQEGAIWATIQAAVQNTVVQIFAQVGKFDWCEPYRIEEQFENCGSGFLIDEEGHVVTNVHVVEGAKYIWLQMPELGRRQLDAQVVSICPDRDLALLKISDASLKVIRDTLGGVSFLGLGDSDGVQRTDSVLTLGYPLGQYHLKSTTGIVSGQEFIFNSSLLEITAPINPGSSGGPLLDIQGLVIGIMVAMIPSAQNVGYVIPVNELKIILNDFKTSRIVRKPFLGVHLVDSSDEKAKFLGNPVPCGVYISQVYVGTLFDRVGVRAGDMLYEFNGFPIDAYGETKAPWSLDNVLLYDLISRVIVGEKIKIVVYRNGKRKNITFAVDEVKPLAIRKRFPDYEDVSYDSIAGMVIMELTEDHLALLLEDSPELIRFRQAEFRVKSVLVVTNIVPGCRAYQLRAIEPGSIIAQVNGISVATLDDWKKALEKSIETGFIALKTDLDVFVVFSLQEVLDDEMRLSEAFSYPISETVKKLQRALKNKKSS